MAGLTFSEFANSLAGELGTDVFTTFTTLDDALVTILLSGREPVVSLCLREAVTKTCSVWKVLLNDESMLRHMEDDVGIYDPTGLPVFASYFCDALLAGLTVVRAKEFYPTNSTSDLLVLRLTYRVGDMRLDGLLKLAPVHRGLDMLVYEMMSHSARIRMDQQLTKAARDAQPKVVPANFVFRKEGVVDVDGADGVQPSGGSDVPLKAKKRKAIGMSGVLKKYTH